MHNELEGNNKIMPNMAGNSAPAETWIELKKRTSSALGGTPSASKDISSLLGEAFPLQPACSAHPLLNCQNTTAGSTTLFKEKEKDDLIG